MKSRTIMFAAGVWVLATAAAWTAPMSVQVESGQVREKPSVFGKVLVTVPYGTQVNVVATQSPWNQVTTADGKTGWMHESILTKKKLALSAGAQDVNRTASGEELAMAGKGFNSQVEADFKEKNKNVDFTWIDKMETFKVDEKTSVNFLKEGGLAQ
mgnify:CR=1 FL=1